MAVSVITADPVLNAPKLPPLRWCLAVTDASDESRMCHSLSAEKSCVGGLTMRSGTKRRSLYVEGGLMASRSRASPKHTSRPTWAGPAVFGERPHRLVIITAAGARDAADLSGEGSAIGRCAERRLAAVPAVEVPCAQQPMLLPAPGDSGDGRQPVGAGGLCSTATRHRCTGRRRRHRRRPPLRR